MSQPPNGAERQRVVVALSGGVDSATAAALLVEQGHEVIGLTLRLYDAGGTAHSSGGRCCGPRDLEDARRVAGHLGIPFYVVDHQEQFRRDVVDDFVSEYLAGRTPNPCVRCNQHVKFGPLLARARALGAKRLATGHYARLEHRDDGRVSLRRGLDGDKDQSYFLFSMPLDTLDRVDFPLGHLRKDQVRALAARLALPNAHKPESQEICFVPDGNHQAFVEKHAARKSLAGDIVDESGAVLGQHPGVHHYTVGQRKGLGAAVRPGQASYVIAVDALTRRVAVGPKSAVGTRSLHVGDVRWFQPTFEPRVIGVQIRHRQAPVPALLTPGPAGWATVTVDGDPLVAAPGQAAVFYDGDMVLGGGWIHDAPHPAMAARA